MTFKFGPRSWILWLLAIVLALVAVYVLFQVTATTPFRDVFLGNLLATLIGIVIGIPVALALAQRQQSAEQKATAKQEEERASERKRQFLNMIQLSLATNSSFLRSVADRLIPGSVIYPNLDIEQLEATSSLKYEIIDDLRLNAQLDLVRFNLRFIRRLLNLSLDLSYSQQRFSLDANDYLDEHGRIVERIQKEIPKALRNITDAAATIAKLLQADGAEPEDASATSAKEEPLHAA